MDDETLTHRLAEDLDGAFAALVLAHEDRLFSIALRLLGSPQDAEEVAQDAFVRSYRALAGYGGERIRALRVRPWLAAIVVNLARNRRRNAGDRRPPVALDPLLEAGLEPAAETARAPEAAFLRAAEARAWTERLARCPATLRSAVVLRHVDGLSYEEIADALGRPVGTVKAQVHRGLANLRGQLETERAAEASELSA